MNEINLSYSIQDIRFASLFGRHPESKKLLQFSSVERSHLLTQAARYPWMQRIIAEERDLKNDLSIEKIKEISRWLNVLASDPDMEKQLYAFLPNGQSERRAEEEKMAVYKPSSAVIKAQAELFRASREGKICVNEQSYVQMVSRSTNPVYVLRLKDGSDRKVAFFKEGEKACYLEKMVWDLSVIIGWEDLFTATKVETLYLKKAVKVHHEKIFQKRIFRHVQGSMQAAIHGVTSSHLPLNARIEGNSLRRAFVAMYLLGFRDLHQNNLFIVHGKFKMFDNAFCLPHGNRWIINQNDILPVHRFSPLNMAMSKWSLLPQEVKEMRQMIEEFRLHWSSIKQYIDQIAIPYPNHWFDKKKVLKALEERLDRLEASLNQAVGKSLCDLMEEIYPEYKLAFILTYIYLQAAQDLSEDEEKRFHSYVGGYYMVQILRKLLACSYDFPLIQKKAEEPGVHVEDLIEWVKSKPQEIKRSTKTAPEIACYYLDMVYWLERQFGGIPRDHKGYNFRKMALDSYGVIQKIHARYFQKKGFALAEGTYSQMIETIRSGVTKPCDYYVVDRFKRYLIFTDGLYMLI